MLSDSRTNQENDNNTSAKIMNFNDLQSSNTKMSDRFSKGFLLETLILMSLLMHNKNLAFLVLKQPPLYSLSPLHPSQPINPTALPPRVFFFSFWLNLTWSIALIHMHADNTGQSKSNLLSNLVQTTNKLLWKCAQWQQLMWNIFLVRQPSIPAGQQP